MKHKVGLVIYLFVFLELNILIKNLYLFIYLFFQNLNKWDVHQGYQCPVTCGMLANKMTNGLDKASVLPSTKPNSFYLILNFSFFLGAFLALIEIVIVVIYLFLFFE